MHDVIRSLRYVEVLDVLIYELRLPAEGTNMRDSFELRDVSPNRNIAEQTDVPSLGSLKEHQPSARCPGFEPGGMCANIASAKCVEPRTRKAC